MPDTSTISLQLVDRVSGQVLHSVPVEAKAGRLAVTLDGVRYAQRREEPEEAFSHRIATRAMEGLPAARRPALVFVDAGVAGIEVGQLLTIPR